MSEPSVFERVVAEAPCQEVPAWWHPSRRRCQGHHPRCILHALATSDEVRAAWESRIRLAIANAAPWGRQSPLDVVRLTTDAILAAIRPDAS